MKLALIAVMIIVLSTADICHAIDPDLNARLGIPVHPQDSGETYNAGLINESVSAGLGGCGDLGISTSMNSLLSLAQSAASNASGLAQTAAMAMLAYFMPTEYSAVSNLMSMAQKYLGILTEKCKTYQAARDYIESKDVAGLRKAAFARCMEENNGDEVKCSKPAMAWYSLFHTTGCVSVVDKSLEGFTLPDKIDRNFIKSFFGDVKMCADGSGTTPPAISADKVYQANVLFYGPQVDRAVSAARIRYLTQDDIQKMKLCVGPDNGGGSGGVICPHAETINMVSSFPDDEQVAFKTKLAERLSLLQTVYNTYSWSSLMNKAASSARTAVPDAFTVPVAQMTGQKEKEVNDLVSLKNQASGNDGDLSSWESRVMERNSYWIQQQKNTAKLRSQYESLYGNTGDKAANQTMRRDIFGDMMKSYNR